MEKTTTYVTVPIEIFEEIKTGLKKIEKLSEVLSHSGPQKNNDHLTVKEFCNRARIGRNKFDEVKDQLRSVRVSQRKILIPATELDRWFSGEIE